MKVATPTGRRPVLRWPTWEAAARHRHPDEVGAGELSDLSLAQHCWATNAPNGSRMSVWRAFVKLRIDGGRQG